MAKSKKNDTADKSGKNDKSATSKLSRRDYDDQLEPLQLALSEVARWLEHTGQRLVVVVEGRDTAGKGGTIAAMASKLNPRQCRTVALGKPSERELSQWYFQRYVPHLPAAGELVLFDRSWYNRAGVEPVMGFCTPEQTRQFLLQAPVFEKMLVDDGILLFKYWLTVDQAQQERRFTERLEDPLKRWKLSPIDLKAREKYAAYGQARDVMLRATHTAYAPWTLVDFNDQRRGRLALLTHLLAHLPDHPVPQVPMALAALGHAPLTEQFNTPLRPIG